MIEIFYIIGVVLCWLTILLTIRRLSDKKFSKFEAADLPILIIFSFVPGVNFFLGLLMLAWI